MAPAISRLFSAADLERISAAVHDAEKRTSGEIVPYVVEQCDEYEFAEWRGGALLALLTAIVLIFLHRFTSIWLPIDLAGKLLAVLLTFGAGMLLVKYVPGLKRILAGSAAIERRLHQRASEAFVAEEVFRTRDRTGILLFLSLLERRVLVLGDAGINQKVKQEEWQDVVATIITGIRSGSPVDGLVNGIQKCGSLLERRGVNIRADDRDELSDALRMKDR
jgi:putative membrane protein